MEATPQPRAWKVLLAFAIIYFVWGSTFLAIRVGVREVPPFLIGGDAVRGRRSDLVRLDAIRGDAFAHARASGAAHLCSRF